MLCLCCHGGLSPHTELEISGKRSGANSNSPVQPMFFTIIKSRFGGFENGSGMRRGRRSLTPSANPHVKAARRKALLGDFTRATARISAILLLMGCGCPTLFKLHSLVTEKKEGSRKDSISVTHFRTCPVTTIIIHDFGGGWIQVPFVLVLAGSHSSYCQKSTLHLQV